MLDISTIFASQSHAPLSSTLPSSSRAFEQLHILARGQQNYDDGQYEEEYDYYQEDYDNPPQSGRGPIPRSRKSGGLAIDLKDRFTSLLELLRNHKQLGASLLGLGLLLTFAGMMLFFEGTLLRLGNMCIIAGIPLLVGPEAVKNFFIKKERTQATAIVSIGILLVFWGKPRIGILCEIFGILNLFG